MILVYSWVSVDSKASAPKKRNVEKLQLECVNSLSGREKKKARKMASDQKVPHAQGVASSENVLFSVWLT